jgi:hypothetical protein
MKFWVSRDSAVGIATSYWLDDRGVEVWVAMVSRIFTSPCRSDKLWGPPNLLSSGYKGAPSPGVKRPGVKLTTHLQLVPRSGKHGSIHLLLHTSSWRSAETTLPLPIYELLKRNLSRNSKSNNGICCLVIARGFFLCKSQFMSLKLSNWKMSSIMY